MCVFKHQMYEWWNEWMNGQNKWLDELNNKVRCNYATNEWHDEQLTNTRTKMPTEGHTRWIVFLNNTWK